MGISLYDKSVENSAIWDVVIINEPEQITYGTGWNYIEEGTKLDGYGKTKNEWLVNYETGEVIQLEKGKYTRLTHGNSIGVTDGLIFNLDPSVIDTTDIEDLKSGNYDSLWKDTELNGFDWNDESGLTPKEFNFDGVNDYIKVKYDTQEQKNALAKNGFTFEYYGTITKGISYDNKNNEVFDMPTYTGIFGYWTGNENQQAKFRFGIFNKTNSRNLRWNAGWVQNSVSDFSSTKDVDPWNIDYPIDYNYGDEIYYTITLDTTSSYKKDGEEYYKQIVYLDGKILYEGGYNKKSWDNFINNDLNNLNYFCIGRSSMSTDGWWHYSKMNAYTLRLYNHALTSDEVEDNHQKSVAYHESLQ